MIEMNFMLEMELLCCTQNKTIFNAQQNGKSENCEMCC